MPRKMTVAKREETQARRARDRSRRATPPRSAPRHAAAPGAGQCAAASIIIVTRGLLLVADLAAARGRRRARRRRSTSCCMWAPPLAGAGPPPSILLTGAVPGAGCCSRPPRRRCRRGRAAARNLLSLLSRPKPFQRKTRRRPTYSRDRHPAPRTVGAPGKSAMRLSSFLHTRALAVLDAGLVTANHAEHRCPRIRRHEDADSPAPRPQEIPCGSR